ncbi:MAG TPA: hypothetical protein PLI53_00770 [Geobacteraceae bacterium]|nr:hypothetical protein [Geobacteraceae bacterium]
MGDPAGGINIPQKTAHVGALLFQDQFDPVAIGNHLHPLAGHKNLTTAYITENDELEFGRNFH